MYYFVVKMEEMAEAKPYIMNKLKFSKTDMIYVKMKGNYNYTYASYYKHIPEAHIKQLQDIYRYDIKIMDYPKSPFE